MALHDNPTKWLSVVQIGITSISILNGIVGDAAFSAPFAHWLHATFRIGDRAAEITAHGDGRRHHHLPQHHLRRAGAQADRPEYPETIARLVARPMEWLSLIARPFVRLLSWCTEATLRLLGIRGGPDRSVTEEEIAASLEEGLDAGVIEAQEHQMVRNVFRLDDRQVGSMMIPRAEIVWLEATATADDVLRVIGDAEHSRYPVCRGGLDDVLGVITRAEAAAAGDPGRGVRASTRTCSRRCSCPRRSPAWSCSSTSAPRARSSSSSSTSTARCRE